MPWDVLNTELWEFNTELKVTHRYVYEADSEPEILYMTTFTTHFIQMIVLFSSKKKAKLGHLIQSAGTGAFGPKAL